MQTKHTSILNAINREGGYNILTFPTHERSQAHLKDTPHTFYLFCAKGIKDWNHKFAPLPSNYHLVTQIPPWVEIDMVVSQSKAGQYQVARKIADQLSVPLITIEHTLPSQDWSKEYIRKSHSMRGDVDVFITKFQKEQWEWPVSDTPMIPCAVDTNEFTPDDSVVRGNKVVTVVNDYINRDQFCNFSLYKRIMEKGQFEADAIGDTKGFSEAANGVGDLIGRLRSCGVFLNTSSWSTMPVSLLEAMSVGCPIVTSATCSIPDIIENGETGWCSNDEDFLIDRIKWCLENKEEAKIMGEKARIVACDMYDNSRFKHSWGQVFDQVLGASHGPM